MVILSQGRSEFVGGDARLCQDRPQEAGADRLAGVQGDRDAATTLWVPELRVGASLSHDFPSKLPKRSQNLSTGYAREWRHTPTVRLQPPEPGSGFEAGRDRAATDVWGPSRADELLVCARYGAAPRIPRGSATLWRGIGRGPGVAMSQVSGSASAPSRDSIRTQPAMSGSADPWRPAATSQQVLRRRTR